MEFLQWKSSYLKPIYKKRNRSDITNYRPIAISSAFSKIFDMILAKKLSVKFKELLLSNQHGFRVGKSTITNLMIYAHDIFKVFSEDGKVDAIYTDFSRAFDSVNHDLLIRKLLLIGLNYETDKLITWITYCFHRKINLNYLGYELGSPKDLFLALYFLLSL